MGSSSSGETSGKAALYHRLTKKGRSHRDDLYYVIGCSADAADDEDEGDGTR